MSELQATKAAQPPSGLPAAQQPLPQSAGVMDGDRKGHSTKSPSQLGNATPSSGAISDFLCALYNTHTPDHMTNLY